MILVTMDWWLDHQWPWHKWVRNIWHLFCCRCSCSSVVDIAIVSTSHVFIKACLMGRAHSSLCLYRLALNPWYSHPKPKQHPSTRIKIHQIHWTSIKKSVKIHPDLALQQWPYGHQPCGSGQKMRPHLSMSTRQRSWKRWLWCFLVGSPSHCRP